MDNGPWKYDQYITELCSEVWENLGAKDVIYEYLICSLEIVILYVGQVSSLSLV